MHTIKIRKWIRISSPQDIKDSTREVNTTKRKQKKHTKAKYSTSFLKGEVSNFHTDGLSCHSNAHFLKTERSGD